MLSIRLKRIGKKKQPQYRLIVTDKKRDPWGKYLESLGNYNPLTDPATINLKTDRIEYWLSQGAQPSNTVYNMLIEQKILKGDKKRIVKISKKRQEKITAAEVEKKEKEEKDAPKEDAPADNTEAPKTESEQAAPVKEKKEETAPDKKEDAPKDEAPVEKTEAKK